MKTVPIVAEHIPQPFGVGGKRSYRLARYLPDHGCRPTILATRDPSPSRSDTSQYPLPGVAVLDRSLHPFCWTPSKGRSSPGTPCEPSGDSVSKPAPMAKVLHGIDFPLGPKGFLIPDTLGLAEHLGRRYGSRADIR